MAVQALTRFFTHDTIKRVLALLAFVGLIVVLRHLTTLLVFSLIFVHSFGFLAGKLASWTPIKDKIWVGIIVLLLLGGIGVGTWGGVHKSLPAFGAAFKSAKTQAIKLKEHSMYRLLESSLEPKKLAEQVKHFSERITKGVRSTGRALLHLVLGLILAVLFLFEREEVMRALAVPPPRSFLGYLLSFFSYLSEAVVLTVKVQVIVAAVNAVVTLPVMMLLGLPHVVALMFMVFVFGLIPVVGNFVSGLILAILAYMKLGIPGVAIFLISTSVLHKVESYYLNPRLVAKHVDLPKLLLIISLIFWEHLLGIAGMFVSFPALYVLMRIRDHFRELDAAVAVDALAPLPAAEAPAAPVAETVAASADVAVEPEARGQKQDSDA